MVFGVQTAQPPEIQPGEGLRIPVVFDLRGVGFKDQGAIDAQLLIDNQIDKDLTFWVSSVPPAAPGNPSPPVDE